MYFLSPNLTNMSDFKFNLSTFYKKKSKASLPCSRNNLYILCYIAYLIMKSAARIHMVMEIFLNLPVNALRTT